MENCGDKMGSFWSLLVLQRPDLAEIFSGNALGMKSDDNGECQLLVLAASHLYTEENYKDLEKCWELFKTGWNR